MSESKENQLETLFRESRTPVLHEVSGVQTLCLPPNWKTQTAVEISKPVPEATKLGVSTLDALVGYLVANRDGVDLSKCVVHVVTPTRVDVVGPLGSYWRTRELFAQAACLDLVADFLNKFHPLEDYAIALRTRFADDSDDLQDLIKLTSSISGSTVKNVFDDGVAQQVEVKQGITMVGNATIPPTFALRPFRTFREVTQPGSPFVLRLQEGGAGRLPVAGLFEADGGSWRLVAAERVRDYVDEQLKTKLPAGVSVPVLA